MTSTQQVQVWVKALMITALLLSAPSAGADVAVPPLKSRIIDLTETLPTDLTAELEQRLASFEAKKGSQLVVLIVPTTQPETIEQYSIRVVESWKLGRKGVDDGVLLLIAKNDRTLRIEVGYGLEGTLPDAMAKRIIEEIIAPKFRQGNFAGGVVAGVESILNAIDGEPLPPPHFRHGGNSVNGMSAVLENIVPILIGLVVFGKVLQSMFGRLIGATVMSTVAGFVGWLFFSSLIVALFISLLIFFLSLFSNTGGGIYRGGPGDWSGGNFGGGGGGFGGGGASGRW